MNCCIDTCEYVYNVGVALNKIHSIVCRAAGLPMGISAGCVFLWSCPSPLPASRGETCRLNQNCKELQNIYFAFKYKDMCDVHIFH